MLTFVEPVCPVSAGSAGAFAVCAVVSSLPPHAASANELTATRRTPYSSLRDLIRDICCSLSLIGELDRTVPGEELEQRPVDLVGVGPEAAVRGAVDDDVMAVLDELVRALAGGLHREDPVGRAVRHQRRHVDLREVCAEVGVPGRRAFVGADR